jgi:hypothetical protein
MSTPGSSVDLVPARQLYELDRDWRGAAAGKNRHTASRSQVTGQIA